ncbi:TRAFAC clade GTPase domain-containing protein [Actinocorallia sp. A-T 12471]|uniref:TRAFAC clade GTPase domain-containing protein n=1 Tax=Actinocorallia sp. A-T 12471 TaxID=3089813 RepID=UPI0029D409A1|nr:GTPase [Actinocorallia sp. A-T 12471]MDX6739360.1 GTPase [Actinocorallia sp. A-T 12471]
MRTERARGAHRRPTRSRPPRARDAVTCPYCFALFGRDAIAYRCLGRAGRGVGCDPVLDMALAAYQGSQSGAMLPPVFTGRGTRASCPDCGRESGRRVCPECHHELAPAYCDTPGRIVALVGAKNAGKSTYIAVLLHELRNRVGTELGTSLVACDDRTIERYKRDFARPLFDQRRLLPTTPSAVTAPREPLVYLLTRRVKGRFGSRTEALTLVLFDTAGEDLRSREVRDLHLRYLEAADAIVFLADPLELVEGGAESEPLDVLARVTEPLRQRHGLDVKDRLRTPIAVALTKIDELELPASSALQRSRVRSGSLDADDREAVDAHVRSLLDAWGAGDLDRYLEQHYAEYGLFGVSALGGAPRGDEVAPGGVRPYRVEDPLLWLLHRFGMLDG